MAERVFTRSPHISLGVNPRLDGQRFITIYEVVVAGSNPVGPIRSHYTKDADFINPTLN